MTRRTSLLVIALVFSAVVVGVAVFVVVELYDVAFEQQRVRVSEIARNRAALLASVARFDEAESADFPGGGRGATMEQLRESHAEAPGFGATGEYTFARRVGDSIAFQVPLRHVDGPGLTTIPLTDDLAQPMQRALAGQVGTMVGSDYRGEEVLAAYRPVPELDLGLVAKIDVDEIRAPYLRTGLVAGGIGVGLILAGVIALTMLGGGLLSLLEATEESVRDRERKLEAALERERMAGERLRLALEASNQGVWDFAPETGKVGVSPEFEEMLGYDPGTLEMTYDLWVDSLHPRDREAVLRRLDEYLSGVGDRYESEFRMRGADGRYRWILSLGEVVERDRRGNPVRFVGTHTDISPLKRAEGELEARRAHLDAAQRLGRMGSWELDASGRTAWWSTTLYELVGIERGEEGADFQLLVDRVHPEDRPRVRASLDKMVDTGTRIDMEFRIDVEGRVRRVRMAGGPVEGLGDADDRHLGIIQDVTEERELEEMLRQAQKMEAVGQLTAGIAHDFNNLLTTILANSDLGLSALDEDEGDEALRAEIREIRDAARRGGELIKQLMAFSRNRHLRAEPADVVELAAEMRGLLSRAFPENVEVELDLPDRPLIAVVDEGAFQQVVLNLATNARDAMPDGGRFVLSVDRVEAPGSELTPETGPQVRVRARDTGRGMEPETVERVFEPFFTTKEVGSGTGLGLSMVYGLMERQGGSVRVSSELGVGTTVSLFFPVSHGMEGGPVVAGPSPEMEASADGRRILLVEDEPALRRVGARILERAGYDVVEAENGQRALEMLKDPEARDGLDLVISDVVMPELGGPDLLRRCREDGIDFPFLFMSGYTPTELTNDLQAGVHGYLPKPWTAHELVAAVGKILREE